MSDIRCSFCGLERERSQVMISGPRVYICGDCVQLCAQIVFEQRDFAGPLKEISVFSALTTDIESTRRRVRKLESAIKTVANAVAGVLPAPHSIACMWCDAQLDDREAAREHTATCARHPAVIALRAREGAP